jgi:hypothetical protein
MNTSNTGAQNARPSTYTKLTYIQKAARVNRKLRTGDITRVAEATGYSTTHVSDVVSGKYFNDVILNKAYDMTRGRITNTKKLDSVMN